MHIRQARADDAAAICRVLRRSIAELCQADHRDDPAILEKWLANKTPETVAVWIANPEGHMFVATDDDAILGVAAMTSAGDITLNYVSPDARFRGVSKALLLRLETTARERGLATCSLTSTETAHRFYLSAGYQAAACPRRASSRTRASGW